MYLKFRHCFRIDTFLLLSSESLSLDSSLIMNSGDLPLLSRWSPSVCYWHWKHVDVQTYIFYVISQALARFCLHKADAYTWPEVQDKTVTDSIKHLVTRPWGSSFSLTNPFEVRNIPNGQLNSVINSCCPALWTTPQMLYCEILQLGFCIRFLNVLYFCIEMWLCI